MLAPDELARGAAVCKALGSGEQEEVPLGKVAEWLA